MIGVILVPLINDAGVSGDTVEIAWLDHAIYMTYIDLESVLVFSDQNPFEELGDIELAGLGKPWSMVSNALHRSIYICDGDDHRIWKIQMPEQEVSRRAIAGYPRSLAISSGGELLAIVGYPAHVNPEEADGFEYENLFIDTFHPENLQRTKSISLPEEMTFVWCFGQSADGNFIISHTNAMHDDIKISIVSTNGDRIIRTLDPRAASANRSNTTFCSWSSFYFTFIDDGQILVVDKFAGRIILLDSQLNDYKFVWSNDEYQPNEPARIVYNRESRVLLIQDIMKVEAPGSSDIYQWPTVSVMELNQDKHTARSKVEESLKDCQQMDNCRTRAVKFAPKP